MFGAWRVRCISKWKWVCFIRPVQNGIWTDGSRPKTEKDFTNRDISMQDAQKTHLRWSLTKPGFFLKNGVFILFLVMLVISGCSKKTPSLRNQYGIQDQHPETWIESNRRIEHFVNIWTRRPRNYYQNASRNTGKIWDHLGTILSVKIWESRNWTLWKCSYCLFSFFFIV